MDHPNVIFRKANNSDIRVIKELFRSTINTVCVHDYSHNEILAWSAGAEVTDNWINRINTHYFILAYIDEVLVGMASVTESGYLDVMYTNHRYQGRGIAKSLLTKMEAYAANEGHRLITSDVSITAKPFFLHMGYKIVNPQLVLCRGVVLRNYNVQKQLC